MQKNLVQGGSISLPLALQARKLGFRELMSTEQIALPFDYGCFIVKRSFLKAKREELKKALRAADAETLDVTYKETIKEYALRIPNVSIAGRRSMIDFRTETAAEARKLVLKKMYDNFLPQKSKKKQNRDRP